MSLGDRRSESQNGQKAAQRFLHMEFLIPSRCLFSLHARMMNATQGRAVCIAMKGTADAARFRATGRRYDCYSRSVTTYAITLYDRNFLR
jgi:predicted membrane GTPase involved in stress response